MPLAPFRPDHAPPKSRRFASLIALVAVASLGLLTVSAGQASAADAQGSFTTTLGLGKAGKALKKSGVSFSAVKPSTQKRLNGKRVRVSSDLKSFDDESGLYDLRGGVKFNKGKRKLVLRGLSVNLSTSPRQIKATVGGKKITAFVANGKPEIDQATGTMKLSGAWLRLTNSSARMIKRKLRTKRIPAKQVGRLAASVTYAFEDPYLDLCGLPATSLSAPTAPEAAELPTLAGAVATTGDPISWGIREGLNFYVHQIGSIQVLDGVSTVPYPGPPNPALPAWRYGFVFSAGEYAANGPGVADDQAILNGTGSVMYCNQPHGFRITISNPTVVIDGDSSRIIADVNSNISGDLMGDRRVDLADLDLTAANLTEPQAGQVRWEFPVVRPAPQAPATDSAVTLSEAGSEALRLCEVNVPGAPPGCLYPPGTLLDALTVTAVVPQA